MIEYSDKNSQQNIDQIKTNKNNKQTKNAEKCLEHCEQRLRVEDCRTTSHRHSTGLGDSGKP